jgi:hypothetical protein
MLPYYPHTQITHATPLPVVVNTKGILLLTMNMVIFKRICVGKQSLQIRHIKCFDFGGA